MEIMYVYRLYWRKRGPLVRVVVFHDIDDAQWFSASLKLLLERYHVLTPKAFREKEFVQDKINVLITFDDGYRSWVTTCLPILENSTCEAVFFINSGLIDVSEEESVQSSYVRDNLKLRTPRETLSWDQVRVLYEAGHMIGGHSKTHLRFSKLQNEVQKSEIFEDKERIESMIGAPVSFFAFPFGNNGDFTPESVRIAREAGYTDIFSTEPGFLDIASNTHVVRRLCLENRMSRRALIQWIEGGYDCYAIVKRICAQ